MSLESSIAVFGYPLLLAAVVIEGETAVVIGGFLAHRGLLSLPMVMLVALVGVLATDQFFFHLGRLRGAKLLQRHPSWQRKTQRVQAIAHRHQVPVILGLRFLYGFRIVTPLLLGTTRISWMKFLVLDLIACAGWSVGVSLAGYYFGRALELLIDDVKRNEWLIVVVVALVGGLVWMSCLALQACRRDKRPGQLPSVDQSRR